MTGKAGAIIVAAALTSLTPSTAEAKIFPCIQALESPSPISSETMTFTVRNATNELKGLIWVTYGRDLEGYTAIQPGHTVTQESFVGHRWAIQGLQNQCSFAFELEAGETSFEITE